MNKFDEKLVTATVGGSMASAHGSIMVYAESKVNLFVYETSTYIEPSYTES
jgi:hypothetical protein